MAYAVITSLMTTLEQVLQFNPTLIPENIWGPLDSLYETLVFLQTFLVDIGNRINDQESLTFLEKKIRDAAYKAEDTVDLCLRSIHVANTENDKSNARCQLYDELKQIANVMDSIQGEVMKFKNDHLHIKEQPATTSLPRRSSRDVLDEEITLVGMEDDFNDIRDQLIGQARELNIVSIVGMGGMGKTTLARQVFSNPSVLCRFDVSSWVTISQEYDAREILINVLSFGTSDVTALYHNKSYDQLLEQLYRKLKGKRYLIVMDDLWSIEAWDLVKRSFPDDNNGSRIMITTRLLEVADCTGNGCPPHHMPFLNFEDSWTLLSNKVFGKEDCPPQLEEIGKQMAEHCQGLPLSLVVIGGLLSKINTTYEDWKKVAENVVSHIGSTTEHCLAILSLSYNWLPPSLKACFLYTGAFLEDAEIPADKLIRIWVAEGFLNTKSDKMLEEVAEESLEDLVSRSLILASRRRANGKLRTCRIHDLLRQLCLKEEKSEKFFNIITKCFDVSSEGMEIERRMCLNPDALNNQNLDLDKGNLNSVRAILCLGESHTFYLDYLCCKIVDSRFQLLRILDAECIRFSSFPCDITQLIHLRYVACTTGTNVPASISNLWNLQTLIVHPVGDELSLPSEIWKMSSLRYIYSGGMYVHAPPKEENILGLQNLETLDSIRATDSNWIEVLTAAPKIKKLGVLIHPDNHEWSKLIDSLICLADLQKLRIHLAIPSSVEVFQMLPGLLWEVFPTNLKSLTLVGTHLLWEGYDNAWSLTQS
ncbi:PREDICTED: putative disease resistance RPP13-like protein 3 [Nicotiana attenuata]|uniref:putative disease resistance RPP13-like protein 3 n=1 Tax=Nicotiana attenuata TaxID=49451 RepID=UPI000904B774|nr:PREDICTED: putative disease resistance RPP13-like protein 3 [Nicotiana attenuata]